MRVLVKALYIYLTSRHRDGGQARATKHNGSHVIRVRPERKKGVQNKNSFSSLSRPFLDGSLQGWP